MIRTQLKFIAGLISAGLILLWWLVNPAIAADRLRIGLSSIYSDQRRDPDSRGERLFKKYSIDPEVIVVGGAFAGGVSSLIPSNIQSLTRWRWRCHQCRA